MKPGDGVRLACICDGYEGLSCEVAGDDCALNRRVMVERGLWAKVIELGDEEIRKGTPLGLAISQARAEDGYTSAS